MKAENFLVWAKRYEPEKHFFIVNEKDIYEINRSFIIEEGHRFPIKSEFVVGFKCERSDSGFVLEDRSWYPTVIDKYDLLPYGLVDIAFNEFNTHEGKTLRFRVKINE